MNDLTIELLNTALNIAQARHGVATHNISSYNTPEINKLDENFVEILGDLSSLDDAQLKDAINSVQQNWHQIKEMSVEKSTEKVSLDEEVSNLLLASGNYKVLADALNRKIGMMNLVTTGKR